MKPVDPYKYADPGINWSSKVLKLKLALIFLSVTGLIFIILAIAFDSTALGVIGVLIWFLVAIILAVWYVWDYIYRLLRGF